MNEKLQYATMLDIPVSTCSVSALTKKRKARKKKRVNDEQVKAELLKKINSEQEFNSENLFCQSSDLLEIDNQTSLQNEQNAVEQKEFEQNTSTVYEASYKRKKTPFKFGVVGVQLAIIGVLVATIFLTNALYKNSGINVFLRGVFGTENAVVDTREHTDFAPVISMGDNAGVEVSEGVITFAGEGSVYAPCDGVVKRVVALEDGKYDIEIEHSPNFKSIIANVEHVYVAEGDNVYGNIPVGYLQPDGASICFTNSQGEVLANYEVVDNMVVWQA